MRTDRVRFGVLLSVTGLWLATVLVSPAPEVDQALARQVLPVVDAHLQGGERFCTERVVEIRRQGDELRIGLEAWCQEYVRSGDALLSGTGEHAPKLVTLVGGPDSYEVRHVESARDGAGFSDSVRRMFSAAGYTEVLRGAEMADPAIEARQVLGLPPDAPVRMPARTN